MIQPVTKFLTVFIISVSVIVSLCDLKHLFILRYSPFLSEWGQYYRLLLLQFNFNNESEILLSITILLKVFNDIERIFGIYKFVSVLIMGFFYNMSLLFLEILVPYKIIGLNLRVSSGPIGLTFIILSFYNDLIPATYKFSLNFGHRKFVFNDKVFVLILASLLFLNQGLNSFIPALNGWLIGKLILNDILPAKNFKLNFIKRQIHNYKTRQSQQRRRLRLAEEEEDESNNFTTNEEGTTPVRPLGVQLLDTFRT